MIVVRLPDSPTEYGQRSVSPQTTSSCESGIPSSCAAMSPIVVFAPLPTSVTPTCTEYLPVPSTRTTALLRPRPARNAMNDTPAPRLTGPRSGSRRRFPARLPLERGGPSANAFVERVRRVRRLIAGLPRHVLEDEFDGIHLQLAATSSIIDWMPKKPCGYSGPRKFPEDGSVRVDGRDRGFRCSRTDRFRRLRCCRCSCDRDPSRCSRAAESPAARRRLSHRSCSTGTVGQRPCTPM